MVFGDVQDVIYLVGDLVIVIFIMMCVVVVKVYIFESGEVGLFKVFMVVEQGMCLVGSGVGDGEVVFGGVIQWQVFVIYQYWLDIEEWMCCGVGFQFNCVWQWSDYKVVGFGLLSGVYYWVFFVIDFFLVLFSGFWVNWFVD